MGGSYEGLYLWLCYKCFATGILLRDEIGDYYRGY